MYTTDQRTRSETAPDIDAPPLAWRDLLAYEPRLADLECTARAAPAGDWHAWAAITRTLRTLAGWHARRPELLTCEVYDTCYRRLLDVWEGAA